MGLFDFVENFFFISLAITVVLIMLLIFHFKQRMSFIESKHEELVNGMKQIMGIINTLAKQTMGIGLGINQNSHITEQSNPEFQKNDQHLTLMHDNNDMNTIERSQNENIASNPHFEFLSGGLGNGFIIGSMNSSIPIMHTMWNSDTSPNMYVSNRVEQLVVSDDDYSSYIESDELSDIGSNIESDIDVEELHELDINMLIDSSQYNDEVKDTFVEVVEDGTNKEVNDVVDVVDDVEHSESIVQEIKEENVKDDYKHQDLDKLKDYKKMSLSQLKATLITRGVMVDTSKMKKADLVQLLVSRDQ